MFKVGDSLIYGAIGVCKIKEITENDMTGIMREYYVLCPEDTSKSVIYVPTDNQKLVERMRKVPEKAALRGMISDHYDDYEWVENHLSRGQVFREIFTDGNIVNNIRLLRTLHNKKEQLASINKHLSKTDDYVYKDCSRFLCSIVMAVLSLGQEEALGLILQNK